MVAGWSAVPPAALAAPVAVGRIANPSASAAELPDALVAASPDGLAIRPTAEPSRVSWTLPKAGPAASSPGEERLTPAAWPAKGLDTAPICDVPADASEPPDAAGLASPSVPPALPDKPAASRPTPTPARNQRLPVAKPWPPSPSWPGRRLTRMGPSPGALRRRPKRRGRPRAPPSPRTGCRRQSRCLELGPAAGRLSCTTRAAYITVALRSCRPAARRSSAGACGSWASFRGPTTAA